MTLGFPLLDLLVGEHGAEIGRPPDGGVRDESEADFVDLVARPALRFEFGDGFRLMVDFTKVRAVELEENPLGPAHVFWVGGGDFTIPVVGESKRLELAAEGLDVGRSGDRGVLTGLDGVLLGRQSE